MTLIRDGSGSKISITYDPLNERSIEKNAPDHGMKTCTYPVQCYARGIWVVTAYKLTTPYSKTYLEEAVKHPKTSEYQPDPLEETPHRSYRLTIQVIGRICTEGAGWGFPNVLLKIQK